MKTAPGSWPSRGAREITETGHHGSTSRDPEAVFSAALARFDCPRRTGRGQAMVRCPAHPDDRRSLSIGVGERGVVLNCKAGCATEAVLRVVGLVWADLFYESSARHDQPRYVVRYPDGRGFNVKVRTGGERKYTWERPFPEGVRPEDAPLYRSETLAHQPAGIVVLTEGEAKADAAARLGFVAVGSTTGAGGCPGPEALAVLRGRQVAIWPDADAPGRRHAEALARALREISSSVVFIVIPDVREKADAADFRGTRAEALTFMRDDLPAEPWWITREITRPAPEPEPTALDPGGERHRSGKKPNPGFTFFAKEARLAARWLSREQKGDLFDLLAEADESGTLPADHPLLARIDGKVIETCTERRAERVAIVAPFDLPQQAADRAAYLADHLAACRRGGKRGGETMRDLAIRDERGRIVGKKP
jgi:hypothetical protein